MAKIRAMCHLGILGLCMSSAQVFAQVCAVLETNENTTEDQLWHIGDMSYIGGFRVSSAQHGPNSFSTTNFSRGAFTLSESGDSIFIAGAAAEGQIAEMEIPAIVNTHDMTEMNTGGILQDFSIFNDPTGRYDPGILSKLRHTGMLAIDGKLIVNYYNWYDANGTETDTTAIYQDSANLATTPITGPFQLDGAARSAGWISPVPSEWQARLGATHVSGWIQGSINSRLSNGPSAYFWNPAADALNETSGGAISAEAGITFPLDGILYNNDVYTYDGTFGNNERILFNEDGINDLWTYMSGAGYGFIIPNTDTYMTVGFSGGHNSGVGYKIETSPGVFSSGHAAYDPEDYYNYYWLWNVTDIESALNGDIPPESVRPYDYGILDTIGSKARVVSGSFDPSSGRLYVSLLYGDVVGTYSRPPLFLAYQINY